MKSSSLLPLFSLLSTAYAWPWPANQARGVDHLNILRRQNDNQGQTTTFDASQTQRTQLQITLTTKPSPTTPTATSNTDSSRSGSDTITDFPSMPTDGASNDTIFDPRDAPGGVSMLIPSVQGNAKYYKIGDWVHFAWNYTSLQATPTAVNIVASCSANNFVYTLASNQTVAEPTGEVYWDTKAYQDSAAVPLLTNQYTLVIYDAAKPINAAPSAGYLSSYNQFTFSMYLPQGYSNLSDFSCPFCKTNSAAGLQRSTMTFLLGTVGITVATFTWFVSGLP